MMENLGTAVFLTIPMQVKICPIREGIRRKLWKGSGTGSTQLVSGILLLFLRKLNNTL